MKKKFAVIGYGGQGDWHCRQIMNSEVAALVGIFDIKEERKQLARSRDILVYNSLEELFLDKTVEAVVVSTPNDSHKELVIKALRAGKHVICEKPVVMEVNDFDEMVKEAKKANRLFTVHQNRRWDVDYLAMKQICTSGCIGEALHIESRVHGSRGIPSDWRSTKAQGGGMILDWGVHLIDQVLQLFPSKIKRIFCTTTHITNQEVDDGFKLNLEFEDGKTALIEVGTYNFLALPRFYLQCQQGTALITDWTQKTKVARLKAWNEKDVLPVQTAAGITKTMAPRDDITLNVYEIEKPKSDVHDFYRNFCQALSGEAPLLITNEEVRKVLCVMVAANLSSEIHQVVEVDI